MYNHSPLRDISFAPLPRLDDGQFDMSDLFPEDWELPFKEAHVEVPSKEGAGQVQVKEEPEDPEDLVPPPSSLLKRKVDEETEGPVRASTLLQS
jgi:hypothetical protein